MAEETAQPPMGYWVRRRRQQQAELAQQLIPWQTSIASEANALTHAAVAAALVEQRQPS